MRRTWRITAIALFILALVLGGLFGNRLLAVTNETRDSLKLYTELVNLAHEKYGADVSYSDLVYSSINGMLRSLDPHTNFLPPGGVRGDAGEAADQLLRSRHPGGRAQRPAHRHLAARRDAGLAHGHPGGRRHQHHRRRRHRDA